MRSFTKSFNFDRNMIPYWPDGVDIWTSYVVFTYWRLTSLLAALVHWSTPALEVHWWHSNSINLNILRGPSLNHSILTEIPYWPDGVDIWMSFAVFTYWHVLFCSPALHTETGQLANWACLFHHTNILALSSRLITVVCCYCKVSWAVWGHVAKVLHKYCVLAAVFIQ